jgi:hypothetical protein
MKTSCLSWVSECRRAVPKKPEPPAIRTLMLLLWQFHDTQMSLFSDFKQSAV